MASTATLVELKKIESEFNQLVHSYISDDDTEVETKDCHKKLADVCQVVRKAAASGSSELNEIVAAADASLTKMFMIASAGGPEAFDFFKSFAHAKDEDLVSDPDPALHSPGNLLADLISYLGSSLNGEKLASIREYVHIGALPISLTLSWSSRIAEDRAKAEDVHLRGNTQARSSVLSHCSFQNRKLGRSRRKASR